jgi:hypothetical protein
MAKIKAGKTSARKNFFNGNACVSRVGGHF